MKRTAYYLVLMTLFLLQAGCNDNISSIESISIDFPHGETRLLVRRNGEALLFYGALPQHQTIRNGTFDIDELCKQLQPRLHENAPREERPNPASEYGMVQIRLKDKSEKTYLIFSEEDFAEQLFSKAKRNIIGQMP